MSSLTEGRYSGEFVVSEGAGTISREKADVDVPAGETLEPGYVLGQVTATGHYAPYDDANSDGTETAAAILCGPRLDNSAGAIVSTLAATIIKRLAEVRANDLEWKSGVDESGGTTDLAALLIIAR